MQKLLRKYLKLIEEGRGKSASELEMRFLENLIILGLTQDIAETLILW